MITIIIIVAAIVLFRFLLFSCQTIKNEEKNASIPLKSSTGIPVPGENFSQQ